MSEIWMDVDAALSEVPINKVALIDDTDFKTREESVTFDQSGLDLVFNFVTTAGAFTQTAVTPTDTAGVYDWVNQGNGHYTIEIPASGGGTINNDTEGFGWFTGFATGILPWTGPTIGFRAAALNNALIDGGDVLDVSLTEMGGVAQSATDLKDFADAGYDPVTNKVQGVVLVDTTTTNTDMVGTDSAALASVCTETRLAELDAANIPADVDAIPTTAMRGTDSAALASVLGTPVGADISADIAAVKADTVIPEKNAAFSNIYVLMVDSTDHVTPKTSLTLTVQRSLDGAAFGAATGTAAEISNGFYQFDATAADMNADTITFRFSGTAADDTFLTIVTR